jgi:NAD(P)-dependent dehydrogenase (short-subunit alcohol dehydrogenase family)
MSARPKTVMITGAESTLDCAVVDEFMALDYQLLPVAGNVEVLTRKYGTVGHDIDCFQANLLEGSQVDAAIQTVVQRHGGIDVLCHLAGGFRMGDSVQSTSDETLDFLMDVNVRTLMPIIANLAPDMVSAGGGKIITIGAFGALRGKAQMGAYAASKSALMRLTESLSEELKGHHVNVNCVLPSIINSPENRAAMPEVDPAAWVQPESLAQVIAFLASDRARDIHGAMIPVAGLV